MPISAPPRRPTAIFRAYTAFANLTAPLFYRRVAAKLRAHDVPENRIAERLGHATLPRPSGRLIWFHAASVGESLSVLALIDALRADAPDLQFLITSGTATSAAILARRMPAQCRHQFAPLDSRRALRRFLAHWQPTLAVFVESELWPQMLATTRAAGTPLALLNARLSAGSIRNWRRFPATANYLLSLFSRISAQTPETLTALLNLGADPATTTLGSDLKAAAGALPYDPEQLKTLQSNLQNRPLWVASSTHPGEEEIIVAAHTEALRSIPDLLLILVPRHPERRDDIEKLMSNHSLTYTTRSRSQQPDPSAPIYLADTLGETGLWYALAPLVFLGGSLLPIGGHNPYEPTHAGAAVLYGPHVTNFAPTYAAFAPSGGCRLTPDAATISTAVTTLLQDPAALDAMRQSARAFAAAQSASLSEVTTSLFALLDSV